MIVATLCKMNLIAYKKNNEEWYLRNTIGVYEDDGAYEVDVEWRRKMVILRCWYWRWTSEEVTIDLKPTLHSEVDVSIMNKFKSNRL
jgi:hypothetical protein